MQFHEDVWKNGIVLSFDLKVSNLQKYYSYKHPENAYRIIKRYLLQNGFEHLKDSDYLNRDLNKVRTSVLLQRFSQKNKWFPLSVEKLNLSPNVESLDISNEIYGLIDDEWKSEKDKEFLNPFEMPDVER